MPPENQQEHHHHDEDVLPNNHEDGRGPMIATAAETYMSPAGLACPDNIMSPETPPTLERLTAELNVVSPDDDDVDDDDNSFHDLDAVLALVAASEEQQGESQDSPEPAALPLLEGDTTIAAAAPPLSVAAAPAASSRTTAASVEEESKEEIEEESKEEISERIPRYYASTAAATAEHQEASVLLESADGHWHPSRHHEEDARLAAAVAEEEELLLALKRSAYEGGGSSSGADSSTSYYATTSLQQQQQHQEATVVAFAEDTTFAPGSTMAETVQAEWIGQDFTGASSSENHNNSSNSNSNNSNNEDQQHAAVAVVNNDDDDDEYDNTQEAMVIDSAPLEKEDHDSFFTEEAQVLLEDESNGAEQDTEEDRKPAAREGSTRRRRSGHGEEALVLGVQERGDIHPSEFDAVEAEDAELVRTDYSYTVAVPSTSQVATAAESASVTTTSTTPRGSSHHHSSHVVTPAPEAMAVVAPTRSGEHGSTTTLTASAVNDGTDLAQESSMDDSHAEEAQVLLETDLEDATASLLEDRKPAAEENNEDGNFGVGIPCRSPLVGRDLSAIAEQEGEVVGIQEDQDIHPEIRAENQRYDSEAEFLGSDSNVLCSENITSSNPVSEQHPVAETTSTTENASVAAAARRESHFSSRAPQAAAVLDLAGGEEFPSAATSIADADLARASPRTDPRQVAAAVDRDHFSEDAAGRRAEVVSIQEVQDAHPAETAHRRPSGVDAELVGTVQATSATLVSGACDSNSSSSVMADLSTARQVIDSQPATVEVRATLVHRGETPATPTPGEATAPLQTASAFVDPHQPNGRTNHRTESEDDLRDAIAAINAMEQREAIAPLPVPLQSPPTEKRAAGSEDVNLDEQAGQDEYSLDWLSDTRDPRLPEQQRIDSSTYETSNGSSSTTTSTSASRSSIRSTAAGIQQVRRCSHPHLGSS